jgi:alpha-D-xyloside xylohydrolase
LLLSHDCHSLRPDLRFFVAVFDTEGTDTPIYWDDNNCHDVGGPAKCYIYDPTQEDARRFYWQGLHKGYYQYGIKVFWLDASEPEISTSDAGKAALDFNNSLGKGSEVGMVSESASFSPSLRPSYSEIVAEYPRNKKPCLLQRSPRCFGWTLTLRLNLPLQMYPYYHTQTIHDGLVSEGESEVVMLTRSAWAGMQRWGAALWSGDTSSHWPSLKVSIQAGLNTQMSGIAWCVRSTAVLLYCLPRMPLVLAERKEGLTECRCCCRRSLARSCRWTTDIGGYSGGRPADPGFRELIVRWFQFGLTCPLFRQHGARATEPWGYGDVSLAAIKKAMQVREDLRSYIMDAMERVSRTGQPINRPLFFDFPEDPESWKTKDVYMFGPTMLAAPVTDMGARNRTLCESLLPPCPIILWQSSSLNLPSIY